MFYNKACVYVCMYMCMYFVCICMCACMHVYWNIYLSLYFGTLCSLLYNIREKGGERELRINVCLSGICKGMAMS